MDLSIIIVNFNTKVVLKNCLDSIQKFTKSISYEVIVIDNASSDSSLLMLKKSFSKVKAIENIKNLGFGCANNQGLKIAKGNYICFLNPDVVLVENSFRKLVKFMDENKEISLCGPKLLNTDNTIQQSVGFFPHLPAIFFWMTFVDDLPIGKFIKPYHVDHDSFYNSEQNVDWVTGAVMFARKSVLKKVGGFDEKIFLYGEEVELCYRLKKIGEEIIFTPRTKFVHIGRASMQNANIGAITGEYKSILYFYKKHKNLTSRFLAFLLLEKGALLRIVIFGLILRRKELLKAYCFAFLHPNRLTLNV